MLCVLPYMGMEASYSMVQNQFNGAKPFEQIVNIPSKEGPIWNLVKTGLAVSEKKKDNAILYMYVAQGQGQITPGDKILIVTRSYIVSFSH